MTTQNGRAFNEWLRAQLKAKKMSQRQLAQQSGVDHSTISRLIRGDRMPSLGTATKLARGLRELRDDADTPQYLGLVAAGVDEPDRPRRVRPSRRRAPERAAGPPDHGVLPRRPDAPLRPGVPPTTADGGTGERGGPNGHGGDRNLPRTSAGPVGTATGYGVRPSSTTPRFGTPRPIQRPPTRPPGRY